MPITRTPESPIELQEKLKDPQFLRDLAELSEGERSKVFAEYDAAIEDKTNGNVEKLHAKLEEKLNADLDIRVAEMSRNLHAEVESAVKPVAGNVEMFSDVSAQATAYNADSAGAELNRKGEYRAADYIRASIAEDIPGYANAEQLYQLRQESEAVMANYTGTIPSKGGLLVPEEFRTALMVEALEDNYIRQRSTVIPMKAGKLNFAGIRDESHSGETYFGGITAYWEDEIPAGTTSEAALEQITLDPKKLTANARVPNDLLADALGLEALIYQLYPPAIAAKEEVGFIEGNGAKRPLGFMDASAGAMISITRATANQINPADIWNMYSRLLPNSKKRKKAVWLTSPTTLPQIQSLALDVGTGGGPLMTFNIGSEPSVPLLGLPVIESTKIPELGDVGDLVLVDLSKYLIGDRQALQISKSEHQYHSTDETGYRFTSRVDARPWLTTPLITEKGDSTTSLSAFIKLGAAS